MAKELSKPGSSLFEQIKKTDENGNEYWTSRDMAKALEYSEYRNFKPVIDKAKEACKNSGHKSEDHFVDSHDMVGIGSGAERAIETIVSFDA
jgi:DNA-damage-inducible protein D